MLTTVSQPYEIGKRAAIELFDKIEIPDSKPVIRSVDVSLIIRQSTSKPEMGEE
jgi:DNA-binding LacI/PurR family transcriptional regulator